MRLPIHSHTFLVMPEESDSFTVTIVFSESIAPRQHTPYPVLRQTRKNTAAMLDKIADSLAHYYQSEVQSVETASVR